MKTHLYKFLLLVLATGFATGVEASDRWETLRAINWVENPHNHTHAGRFGELGPYQFRQTTWRMHTDKSFRLAIDRSTADEVAVKHYEWIKRTFERAGVEPTVTNIAMAWNCGAEAVISGRVPRVTRDYAERVGNLVDIFKERTAMVQETAPVVPSRAEEPASEAAREGQVRFRILQDTPRFVLASTD